MNTTPSPRVYGGVDASERVAQRRQRLLDAGLDLLGGAGESSTLTVRGACTSAGVVARYFYENFDDADALAIAVYEGVVKDLVAATLTSLEAAESDEREQIRVGLTAIVGHLAADARRGRLLFATAVTHPALAAKRLETMQMLAGLLAAHAEAFYEIDHTPRLEAMSRFLVGGFGETLTAWQHGELELAQSELVEVCAELFAASAASLRIA